MKYGLRWALSWLLIWQGGLCLAQFSGSGDIRGTVTDNTGALIPGATVTVLNVDTAVSKSYVTDSVGLYETSSIVAGNYKITFSKDGFEKLVRGPVTVQVGYTTVNAQLTVGSVSQQVVVHTDVPLLNTESHEQSTTLEAEAMEQMPEVGQDWENFTVMVPGATGTPSGGTAANPGQNVSVNGNLPFANFTLGAIWYGTTKANGRTAMESPIFSSVLPRFGFSRQLKSNMTVRGSYGLYDYNYTLGTKGIGMGGVEQFYGSAADQTNGISPAVVLSSSGSDLPWESRSTDPAALNGQTPNYSAYHAPDNKIHQ